ncbi:hypothetical protein Sjap_010921 [Stephania japonica]|uniref:KIB1-4 beta-propeller domain-containing protein n=1 Tax=Stephania japonica TaxID=461633 RepID=A0AAP0P508_9MAGN
MGCKEAPNLPHDVLHSIVGRLSSLVCCAAFRSVCKPWRSFFMKHYSHLVPPPPPWLMLPDLNYLSDSSYTKVYGLYGSDEQKQFYQCKIPDNCEIFVGSSGTWLAYIDNKRRKLRVWNPLSLTEISLPFVSNKAIKLGKVVVSCPGPLIKNAIEDVVFGAVYDSTQFACIALGDKDWTNIEVDFFPSKPTIRIDDLVFYKGKFFLVDHSGMVFVCERNVPVPRDHDLHYRHPLKAIKLIDHVHMSSLEQNLIQEIPSCAGINNYYLIEIEGELMLVVQFTYTSYFRSIDGFKIFKFDFSRSRKLQALMRKVNVRGCESGTTELSRTSQDITHPSTTLAQARLIASSDGIQCLCVGPAQWYQIR